MRRIYVSIIVYIITGLLLLVAVPSAEAGCLSANELVRWSLASF